MKPSCVRVFEIPELVHELSAYIDKRSLSRLMTTCRLIHTACEPSLYNTLDIYHTPYVSHRIRTLASLTALARNTQHIRHLKTGLVFIAYLCEAMLAYQESQQQRSMESSPSSSSSPGVTQSLQLLPADHSCLFFPLPPLTRLTTLSGSFDRTVKAERDSGNGVEDEESDDGSDDVDEVKTLVMPTPKDARTCLAQMCWLAGQSPWLTTLTLTRYWITCYTDVQLLTETIAGACRLERLLLQLTIELEYHYSDLWQDIFFSAPESLEQLHISEFMVPALECENETLLVGQNRDEWKKYKSGRLDMTPRRRQGPLPNLSELDFMGVYGLETLEQITSILDCCPALVSLAPPCIEGGADLGSFADHVAGRCPRIRKLIYRQDSERSATNNTFIFALLNALPEQTIESICCGGFDERELGTTAARSLQRHSLTLRTIDLMGCDEIQSRTVQTILQECRSLEGFFIWNVAPLGNCFIELEDAVAAIPWACTGIKELRLVVRIHELYRTMGEYEEYEDDELRPYYERPAPIYLTDFEKEQFSLLERFFRQIGQLLDLEVLALRSEVIPEGFEENDGMWGMDTYPGESFPALLSLGDQETGRPGFLRLLGGLTKLRQLSGSIEVNDKENSKIVGWNEVRWLAKHLPSLEQAEFFNVYTPFDLPTQISPYMQWLIDQRPTLRMWRSFA